MGFWDFFFGKKETKKQNYVITTQSGSTYQIERTTEGVWLLYRPGKKTSPIKMFGGERAETMQELTQDLKGEIIYFLNSEGGMGSTTRIKTIAKRE